MATNNKKPSVLIIDDNEMTRSLLRSIIQGDAYDVVGEASNGVTGLERTFKLSPDIVCLDISMPDMNGLEVLLEIKKELPQTVVLMVTASNDIETVQQAIKNGASGFIVKPFVLGTVLDTLGNAVQKLNALKSL